MIIKGKDTIKEKKAIQKRYQNAFRIPHEENRLLYHYAGIETIWKILDGDAFLARNIRFSNDSEEYRLGEKVVSEYATEFLNEKQLQKFKESILQGIQMFYMICFCKDGDLLSQWRGYAKDGVCLGMDFLEEDGTQEECVQVFTIRNNKVNQSCDEEKKYTCFVEMPYQVFYVLKNESINATDKSEQMNKLKEALDSFDDVDNRVKMMLNLIPFIKDKGFDEEAEYRIIFDINDLGETEAQNRKERRKKIEYIEKDNRRLPNIIVEMGDRATKSNQVTHVILGVDIRDKARNMNRSDADIEQIYQSIKNELKGITCENVESKRDIYIGEGNNQEDVMSIIEDCLQQNGLPIDCETGVKIWCRGHLPIREAIIAPGEKKDKIRESLKHYLRNTYWLRYVVVKDSEIPLQS